MASSSAIISLKSYLRRSQFYLNLCLVGLTTIAVVIIATKTFKHYAEENLRLISHSLAEQLQAPLVFDDKTSVQLILKQFNQQYQLASIQVFDKNDQMIYQNHSLLSHYLTSPLLSLQSHIIDSKAGETDIVFQHNVIGHVKILDSIEPIEQFLQLLLSTFIGCILFGLLLIYLNTRFIDYKINRSLDILAQSSHFITNQQSFTQRVPMGDIKEFNQISENFNRLLDELECWQYRITQENQTLAHRALHDPLTQIANRDYFDSYIQQLFHQAPRQPFALFYLDNNHFKKVNDVYGHSVGDQLLCAMVNRIKEQLAPQDFLARLGGDEFGVILHQASQPQDVMATIQKLLNCQKLPVRISDVALDFRFSIGIAFSWQANSVQELIQHADYAMYQVKQQPEQQFRFFQSSSSAMR